MEQERLHIPVFLALLRASLWDTPFDPPADTQWALIHRELQYHTVENLPVDLLAQADPGNQLRLMQHAAKHYTHWYNLMAVQQQAIGWLEAAAIPCAVIKGAAADLYYPNPLNRCMGDVDLIVKPQDFPRAVEILLAQGCTLLDDRNPRHTEFEKDGIIMELHRNYATLSHPQRVSRLDGLLFDALDRTREASIEGYRFPMLPPAENGLVLMEHINSHMVTGLGLRQIIDWMLYANRELDDDAWFGGFQGLMVELGLEKLAETVTRMCQIYLGLRTDITWCRLADTELCHRLMEHILQQGNFGRKQDGRVRGAVNVLSVMDSDLNFFQLLQRHGCHNWKALKQYPWLKPFAWAYQLCRYLRKGLRGKRPIRAFFRAFRKKSQTGGLLTELEVQRKDHTLHYDSEK